MGFFLDSCPICNFVQFKEECICRECHSYLLRSELLVREISFDVLSLLHYEGKAKNLVRQFKGGQNKNLMFKLTKIMALKLLKQIVIPKDLIIVPAPPKQLGHHDHASCIAEYFGALLCRPVSFDFLKRSHPEDEQKKKSEASRFKTQMRIQNHESRARGFENIILVDDVVTTGATLMKMKKYFPNRNVMGLTLASTVNRY